MADITTLKKDIETVLSEYTKNPNAPESKKIAQLTYLAHNKSPLLDKKLRFAINLLIPIGWETAGMQKPTKEEVEKALTKVTEKSS